MNGEKFCETAISSLRENLKANNVEIQGLFPEKIKMGFLKNPILVVGCQKEQIESQRDEKNDSVCLVIRLYVPQIFGGIAAGKLFETAMNVLDKSSLNISGISRGKMSVCADIGAICLEGTVTVASSAERTRVIIDGKEFICSGNVSIKTKKKETNIYSVWEKEPIVAEEQTEYFITLLGLPFEENWINRKDITLIVQCKDGQQLIYKNCKCIQQEQKISESKVTAQTEFFSESFIVKGKDNF